MNLAIIAVFYCSLSGYVFSQSTEGQSTTSNPQQPAIIQGESEPPWYYYWPDENLNPFGLSTLGNDEGGSTFGKSTKRRSNLQVNPPPQEQMRYEENVDNVSNEIPSEETLSPQESISVVPPSTGGKKGPMYKWVDDNGVIQVTNDLGSVPTKYLDQINVNDEPIQTE